MSKKILLPTHSKFQNLTGRTYGHLTVLKYSGSKNRRTVWICICVCGNQTKVNANNLRSGNTQSCGCSHLRNGITHKSHGMNDTPEYHVWEKMIDRCNNPNHISYKNYGARGIKVCTRWLKFENFYKDMGNKPTSKHQIDRKDNNKGYSKANCRWVTPKENSRNTRKNRNLTYKNKTMCLAAWSEYTGIHYSTLYLRLNLGWSIEKTLTTPPKKKLRTS